MSKTNTKKMDMVISLLEGVRESLKHYEFKEHPLAGHNIPMCDSKESITRRIKVAREELLKISKDLEGGW